MRVSTTSSPIDVIGAKKLNLQHEADPLKRQKKMTSILLNLYTNPFIWVQELISNAEDSRKEAGVNKPIEVNLTPTDCKISDWGIGMDDLHVAKTYTMLHSEKDYGEHLIGGYGLGSKTPLTYNERVIRLDTTRDGVTRGYVISIVDNLIEIDQLYEFENDVENQTHITIPIKSSDYELIYVEILKACVLIDNSIVKIQGSPISFNDRQIVKGNHFYVFNDDLISDSKSNIYYMKGVLIAIGPVIYKCDNEQVIRHFNYMRSKYLKVSYMPFGASILKFNIDDLKPLPTREGIEYTEENIAIIKEKIDKLFYELKEFLCNVGKKITPEDVFKNPDRFYAITKDCHIKNYRVYFKALKNSDEMELDIKDDLEDYINLYTIFNNYYTVVKTIQNHRALGDKYILKDIRLKSYVEQHLKSKYSNYNIYFIKSKEGLNPPKYACFETLSDIDKNLPKPSTYGKAYKSKTVSKVTSVKANGIFIDPITPTQFIVYQKYNETPNHSIHYYFPYDVEIADLKKIEIKALMSWGHILMYYKDYINHPNSVKRYKEHQKISVINTFCLYLERQKPSWGIYLPKYPIMFNIYKQYLSNRGRLKQLQNFYLGCVSNIQKQYYGNYVHIENVRKLEKYYPGVMKEFNKACKEEKKLYEYTLEIKQLIINSALKHSKNL